MNGTRKKLTGAVSAVLLGLSVAGAQAGNAVGYIRIEVPAGLSLMTVPFDQVGGAPHTLGTMFSGAKWHGLQIVMFNQSNGFSYFSYSYDEEFPEESGWYQDSVRADDVPLSRGVGFWVQNNSNEPITAVLRGEVPVGERPVQLAEGLQIIGFSFPVAVDFDDISGLDIGTGDQLVVYSQEVGFKYYTYFRDDEFPEDNGWYQENTKVDIVVQPGVAFWYKRQAESTSWSQVAPYTL